jgi:hypothetical protein
MNPIKDKSLLYFVIEDEVLKKFNTYSQNGNYSMSCYDRDMDFSSVIHLLNAFKNEELSDLFIKIGPRDYRTKLYGWVDCSSGKAEYKTDLMKGDYSVILPVKIVSVEEVKSLHPYAGSVDFTIGTSTRKKENKKVLVGVYFDWSQSDEQIKTFNKNNVGIELKTEELYIVDAIFQKMKYDPLGYMSGHSYGGFHLEVPFLGNGIFSGMDVSDYTYDELYKYYTLLV